MPRRRGRWTEPVSASSSPARIFMNVDLPDPLGPVRPKRRPGANETFTSSKSFFGPKALVTSWTAIMARAPLSQPPDFRELFLGRGASVGAMPSPAGLIQRRIVEPVKAQLRLGITPRKLALSLALGVV